jgi:hypothetical protein
MTMIDNKVVSNKNNCSKHYRRIIKKQFTNGTTKYVFTKTDNTKIIFNMIILLPFYQLICFIIIVRIIVELMKDMVMYYIINQRNVSI